jgi:predicted nucleic acid-binding protein
MATLPNNLKPIFLDTAYVYALVNTRDQWHEQALNWQRKLATEGQPLITTELILVEIADGLAAVKFRAQAATVLTTLQSSAFVEIVPFSSQLLSEAFALYRSRQDKDWGLTDCVSFVVMRERALSEALTMDEHFRQAGFSVLLRES